MDKKTITAAFQHGERVCVEHPANNEYGYPPTYGNLLAYDGVGIALGDARTYAWGEYRKRRDLGTVFIPWSSVHTMHTAKDEPQPESGGDEMPDYETATATGILGWD